MGYGIVAPEQGWDDYKGADLKGRVLLVMNNDPESDPRAFAGKRRLYYGRWDYKFEMAARLGAAGAIIVHTDASAGYGWKVVQSSWTGEQLSLPAVPGEPTLPVKAWATEEACRRIARLGGHDLDALRAAAERRDFRPVPLGVRLSLALRNEVSRRPTANVIGRLPGRDPVLGGEAVVYSAHHDHLGAKRGPAGEPVVYNGALDNASGLATMLAIARGVRLPARAAAPLDPLRGGGGGGAGAARLFVPRAPLAGAPGAARGERQHRRHEHLGPHARRPGHRPRQVLARRLGPRHRGGPGPGRGPGGLSGQGRLLPLRSPELRPRGGAGAHPGRGHRSAREAARAGAATGSASGRRRTTTSPPTTSRAGTSPARSRTPSSCSCSGRRWRMLPSRRRGGRATSSRPPARRPSPSSGASPCAPCGSKAGPSACATTSPCLSHRRARRSCA